MKSLILLISLSASLALGALTKEELRSQTEDFIRAEQRKKQRLQRNELLDDSAEIYFDGNRTYPGLIINGIIYPAILRDSYRYPACLVGERLVEGRYDSRSERVLCELDTEPPLLSKSPTNNPNKSQAKEGAPKTQPQPAVKKKSLRQSIEPVRYQSGIKAEVMEVNAFKPSHRFGIRAGSWAKVYLPRAVSSSEPADIELELLEDVVGLHRTLPSGTIFFTRHSVNPISQRLDMEVAFMVLPDGREMQLSATIHSSGGGAGLAGAIITHSDTVAKSSAGKNLLTGAQEAIGEAGTNNPLTGVAGRVTQDVIESKKQLLPQPAGFSVQLAPQQALIRFRRSF